MNYNSLQSILMLIGIILVIYTQTVFAATPDINNPGVSIKICGIDPILAIKFIEEDQYDWQLDQFFHLCDEIDPAETVFAPTSKFLVLIHAPAWNTNPNKIDFIGNDIQSPISVYTNKEKVKLDGTSIIDGLPCTGFAELGPDLGLFAGSIRMRGFQHDYDGDRIIDTEPFTFCSSGSPYGDTLNAVFIKTERKGSITIAWQVTEDFTLVKSVTYGFREAQAQFDKSVYKIDDEITITMKDLDYMLTDGWEQPWKVWVYSDSDLAGIDVRVWWDYGKNIPTPYYIQDEFYGTFVLTDTDKSVHYYKLRVNPGDKIYLKFDDYSLPPPYGDGKHITITDTAQVVFSNEIPEGISLNSVLPTRYDGEPINEIKKGDRIQIKSLIENHTPDTKTVTCILLIQNSEGFTESISWNVINLMPNAITDCSQSYHANNEGNYIAKIFVWDNINNVFPLTESIETFFVVD